MKVTFCAYDASNYVGGPNAWLRRLLPHLKKKGADITVIFITGTTDPSSYPTVKALNESGIKTALIPWHYYTEDRIKALLKKLRSDPPDIFVPNLAVPAFLASKWVKKAGIPTVGILHSDDAFHHALIREFVLGRKDFTLSAIVSVSTYLEELVLNLHPDRTIVKRLPYGAPVPSKTAVWNDETLQLIYVGRLEEEQKRISDVTRALCEAVQLVPETNAVIYGDGGARKNVEIILANQQSVPVKLAGRLDSEQIQQEMLQSQVLVLLSDYEGLPIALMEAMACGIVPICLRGKSGIKELIKDGINGILVDNREDSFYKAVERLKKEPELWKRLSESARRTIIEEYSDEVCADRWFSFLEVLQKEKKQKVSTIKAPLLLNLPPAHPDMAREEQRKPGIKYRLKKNRYTQRVIKMFKNK